MSELEPVGIIFDESNELYHSRAAISNSKLGVASKSLELYYKRYVEKSVPAEYSDAFEFGTQSHTYVLEGEQEFFSRYSVLPDRSFALNTGDGKKNYSTFVKDAVQKGHMPKREGETMLRLIDQKKRSKEEFKTMGEIMDRRFLSRKRLEEIRNVKKGVDSNPDARELLARCQSEVTFRTPMTDLGFQLQCRADAYSVNGCEVSGGQSFAADLKTIDDLDNFQRNFYNFGYYRQGPFYAKIINALSPDRPIENFYFIFVEKKEPFRCKVFESDLEAWELGEKEFTRDLERLSLACQGLIPWKDESYSLIGLKPWATREIEERLSA